MNKNLSVCLRTQEKKNKETEREKATKIRKKSSAYA